MRCCLRAWCLRKGEGCRGKFPKTVTVVRRGLGGTVTKSLAFRFRLLSGLVRVMRRVGCSGLHFVLPWRGSGGWDCGKVVESCMLVCLRESEVDGLEEENRNCLGGEEVLIFGRKREKAHRDIMISATRTYLKFKFRTFLSR